MVSYRAEIDGLRAIAVVPVVLYHAGFHRFFAGGYVGVDIFFVISGYLITSIIIEELETNKFSLARFYERRCRRILPAVFFILFCSSFFSYYWMLPDQLFEFGQTLISVVCLSSNIFFWWKDDGYFSKISELNPLVHTWSLAVEEQFYFVFPLLCYFLHGKKRCLIIILIVITFLSFFLAQWGGNFESKESQSFQMFAQHSSATFYLPIGRTWELLFGSFTAFYLRTKNQSDEINTNRDNFLSSLGFILIGIAIVLLNSRQIHPFPNCYTLLPTIGAILIILYGNKNTFTGYILSTSPLRWIGLVSYSVYLWHQPLLAFLRLRYDKIPSSSQLTVILFSVSILSIFSYFLVEQPFRTSKWFSRRCIFSLASIFTLITLLLALFFIRIATNRSQTGSAGQDSYLSDLKKYGHMRYTAHEFFKLGRVKTFSNSTLNTKKIALIGDSYAQDFYNVIREGRRFSRCEIRVYYISVDCQIYIGEENRQNFIEARHKQKCLNDYNIKDAFPLIRQADIIILAGSWRPWSAQRLPMTLKLLNLTKQQQLLVIGAKHFGTVRRMLYMNKTKEYRIKQYGRPKQMYIDVNQLLEKTISKLLFVNILRMICTGPNFTCPHFTPEGKLISYDNFHLTKYGTLYVGNIIFKNEPLNQLSMCD